jgi:hypothetical protein
MSTSEIFRIAMTIILTVPYLVWRLGRMEYYAARRGADRWRHPARGPCLARFETGEKKIRDQAAKPDSHELQTWIRLSKSDASPLFGWKRFTHFALRHRYN